MVDQALELAREIYELRRGHARELNELDELLEALPFVGVRFGSYDSRPNVHREQSPERTLAQPFRQRLERHGGRPAR
jgi:hypothetical protein